MSDATWEPVSQDVLEHAADPHLDGVLHGDTSYAVASELLAARALLVALVEAEAAAEFGPRYDDVVDAIRAHVARLKDAERTS